MAFHANRATPCFLESTVQPSIANTEIDEEITRIEHGVLQRDVSTLETYGGLQAAVKRRVALKKFPLRSHGQAIIDSFSVWRSMRSAGRAFRRLKSAPCRSGHAHPTMGSMCTERSYRCARRRLCMLLTEWGVRLRWRPVREGDQADGKAGKPSSTVPDSDPVRFEWSPAGRGILPQSVAHVRSPILHQLASALEQVRAGIGRLDLVLDDVAERALDDFARVVRLLGRLVPGTRSESGRERSGIAHGLRRQLEPKPRNDWTAWLIVLIVTPFASDHVSEATACFARLNQSMAIGRPCCMDHPEGCLIIMFFNTGDNLRCHISSTQRDGTSLIRRSIG